LKALLQVDPLKGAIFYTEQGAYFIDDVILLNHISRFMESHSLSASSITPQHSGLESPQRDPQQQRHSRQEFPHLKPSDFVPLQN
jgi:hypothetical protein